MPTVRTVITADGTVTLQVPELNEHYHSIHGAMQESMHVFIRAGLHAFPPDQPLRIFEVGFGTGLNVLLTRMLSQSPIVYHAIEMHPLPADVIAQLNYAESERDKNQFELIHLIPWDEERDLNHGFRLKKINGDLLIHQPDGKFDLVYFDAFGPNTQPELWTKSVFRKMHDLMNPGGILVTYCAKGEVKRNLKEVGFEVETLPGPPGKREMTRAKKKVQL